VQPVRLEQIAEIIVIELFIANAIEQHRCAGFRSANHPSCPCIYALPVINSKAL
jgi:hypothetical protein